MKTGKKTAVYNLIKKVVCIIAAAFIVCSVLVVPENTYAKSHDYKSEYATTQYGTSNGLTSMEINAICQSKDGYIWVGSYAGLYRFDGTKFTAFSIDEHIKNVTALFSDSRGRLWIGTNDQGVACYDAKTQAVTFYKVEDGLSSDTIRTIAEDYRHNIYVGTTNQISIINNDGSIVTPEALSQISFAKQLVLGFDNVIAGVTNNGDLFFIKDKEIIDMINYNDNGIYYTSVCKGKDKEYYVGTSTNLVISYQIGKKIHDFQTVEGISNIQQLYYEEANKSLFICAGNGFGYLNDKDKYIELNTMTFNSSVGDVIKDYQGNFWFASDKQGVLKLSPSVFVNVFEQLGLENHVVNSIERDNTLLYIGCDDGLIVVDSTKNKVIKEEWMSEFEDIRIRHILKDRKGKIWFSTYGENGLVCKDGDKITYFNESNGTQGGRFRSTIELQDGTILAATSTGLSYIKDGLVIATMSEDDGLDISQILCMQELADGTIYAGSDGGGIYIIKDKKVVGKIDKKNGLDSLVVMRMVPCQDGFLYVTSNALYYDKHGELTVLDAFPYSNNYDIYISKDKKAWIYGSAGIYVVDEYHLLENKEYNYALLNNMRGLDTTLSANAWTYVDVDENYYLCCSTGVMKISIPGYNQNDTNYNIAINQVNADGVNILRNVDGSYTIPAGVTRISISPAILNYSMSDPLVHIYLEGFDEVGETSNQSELSEINFTKLPYGDYKFHIDILNETDMTLDNSYVAVIHKEAQLYEYARFKIYLIFVIIAAVIMITWMLSKYSSLIIIGQQYNEIEKAKNEAENANQAKSQFLASMSHEIRTPINTIMGMDELIMREDITDDVYDYALNINSASKSLLAIIDDILDLSKIESGKMNIINNEYDTIPLFYDLVEMLEVNALDKKIEPIVEIDTTIPSKLYGDAGRLKQVIINLLSNAIKYTEEGSVTLKISMKEASAKLKNRENDYPLTVLCVSVTDTGIGIKKEDMERLFGSFERLDEKRNANIKGTGLGLNISKQLLEMMGSSLRVESEYGKGSTFFFEIEQAIVDEKPIGDPKTRVIKKKENYKSAFTAPDASVLVIDDTEMNLKVIEGLLKESKMTVDTGISGFECLEMIKDKHYDIIFLDHMMPELNGVETFEQMKKDKTHKCVDTPVIVLTANAIVGAREEYLELGFDDYLSKPVNSSDLEKIILDFLPEDKINRDDTRQYVSGGNQEPVEEITDTNDYEAKIKSIEELDYKTGMSYCCDSAEFYYEIIQTYYKTNHIPELKSYYEEQKWEDYQIRVHAIKSTSLAIGATELSELAKMLEIAAREHDIDTIDANHNKMIEMYDKLLNSIKTIM